MSKTKKGWSDDFQLRFEKLKSNEKDVDVSRVVNGLRGLGGIPSRVVIQLRSVISRFIKRG